MILSPMTLRKKSLPVSPIRSSARKIIATKKKQNAKTTRIKASLRKRTLKGGFGQRARTATSTRAQWMFVIAIILHQTQRSKLSLKLLPSTQNPDFAPPQTRVGSQNKLKLPLGELWSNVQSAITPVKHWVTRSSQEFNASEGEDAAGVKTPFFKKLIPGKIASFEVLFKENNTKTTFSDLMSESASRLSEASSRSLSSLTMLMPHSNTLAVSEDDENDKKEKKKNILARSMERRRQRLNSERLELHESRPPRRLLRQTGHRLTQAWQKRFGSPDSSDASVDHPEAVKNVLQGAVFSMFV